MNPTLKLIISFLLQLPLFFVVANGIVELTGINIWWTIPICILIVVCYDIGEKLRRNLNE